MAICILKSNKQLGVNFILTPERYNPRRRMSIDNEDTILMSEIVEIVNDIITKKQAQGKSIIQINTSDAMGGYLNINSEVNDSINSNKKILRKGDVIISRLRPYLRQVAYVDEDRKEILLVPFLLSQPAQLVFENSVEGSQHPRFKEEDVLNLKIPKNIYDERANISKRVIEAIESYRSYERSIFKEIKEMNKAM